MDRTYLVKAVFKEHHVAVASERENALVWSGFLKLRDKSVKLKLSWTVLRETTKKQNRQDDVQQHKQCRGQELTGLNAVCDTGKTGRSSVSRCLVFGGKVQGHLVAG